MSENRCVCCGEIIPEGMIACPNCLVVSKKQEMKQEMKREKRLIDANAFKSKCCKHCNDVNSEEPCEPSECVLMLAIDVQPTVDAVEVVHGRWIDVALRYTQTKEKCSVCGGIVYAHGFNYCPNCGAKMRGSE